MRCSSSGSAMAMAIASVKQVIDDVNYPGFRRWPQNWLAQPAADALLPSVAASQLPRSGSPNCSSGRADKARTLGVHGTGLGLYICHGIVEIHGGLMRPRAQAKVA